MNLNILKLKENINICNKCFKANKEFKNFPFKKSFEWIPKETRIFFLAAEPPEKENYFYTNHESRFTRKILKLLFKSSIINNTDFDSFVKNGLYLTDLVKCPKGDIEKCKDFLVEEINLLNPKIICTLGSKSLKFISKNKKIKLGDFAGDLVPSTLLKREIIANIPVFPCYFPIRYSGITDSKRIEHFKKLSMYI